MSTTSGLRCLVMQSSAPNIRIVECPNACYLETKIEIKTLIHTFEGQWLVFFLLQFQKLPYRLLKCIFGKYSENLLLVIFPVLGIFFFRLELISTLALQL